MTFQACRFPATSAVLAATFMIVSAAETQAQNVFWDWGGEKKVDGAGRELVRMPAAKKPGDIIVSFSDRRLYFVTKPGEALRYPIAIPREDAKWSGVTTVSSKRENPSWTPTPSMIAKNPRLPSWVPGGHPLNPLGVRALYLGSSTYRIHGTDAPWTIGTSASAGCVRMYNQDVADLYPRAHVGASVLVTWDKFEATPDPDAKIAPPIEIAASKESRRAAHADTASSSIRTGSLAERGDARKQAGTPLSEPVPPKSNAVVAPRHAPKTAKQPVLPELLSI